MRRALNGSPRLYRVISCIGFCLNVLAIVYFAFSMIYNVNPFRRSGQGYVELETLDPDEVDMNKSIFFLETNRLPAVEIKPRQACSVESAARANPDRQVYVLVLSPRLKCTHDMTAVFRLVTHYRNVRIRHVDFYRYVSGTPAEAFVKSGTMNKGQWPVEQRSDLLRLLTLWKFGGVYMDIDVVSLRPVPMDNFVIAENPGPLLGSGVIGVQNKSIAAIAIKMFIRGFVGDIWTHNGPLLITRLTRAVCKTDRLPDVNTGNANCGDLTIYRAEVFSPIPWNEWPKLFLETDDNSVMKAINNSVGVHFWNRITKDQPVLVGSMQPYAQIAATYCPVVYGTADVYL